MHNLHPIIDPCGTLAWHLYRVAIIAAAALACCAVFCWAAVFSPGDLRKI